MTNRKSAQRELDAIVAAMLDNDNGREVMLGSYPVEATHKNGFKVDRLPTELHGNGDWEEPWRLSSMARLLVGGYFSKASFVKLVWLLLKEREELRARVRHLECGS